METAQICGSIKGGSNMGGLSAAMGTMGPEMVVYHPLEIVGAPHNFTTRSTVCGQTSPETGFDIGVGSLTCRFLTGMFSRSKQKVSFAMLLCNTS